VGNLVSNHISTFTKKFTPDQRRHIFVPFLSVERLFEDAQSITKLFCTSVDCTLNQHQKQACAIISGEVFVQKQMILLSFDLTLTQTIGGLEIQCLLV